MEKHFTHLKIRALLRIGIFLARVRTPIIILPETLESGIVRRGINCAWPGGPILIPGYFITTFLLTDIPILTSELTLQKVLN